MLGVILPHLVMAQLIILELCPRQKRQFLEEQVERLDCGTHRTVIDAAACPGSRLMVQRPWTRCDLTLSAEDSPDERYQLVALLCSQQVVNLDNLNCGVLV